MSSSLPECAQYYFLHEGQCVGDCPDGYYAEPQECVRCHADCASCDGPSFDDCAVCHNPKAVRYNGECLAKCPNSTYYDATANECRGKGRWRSIMQNKVTLYDIIIGFISRLLLFTFPFS